MKYSERICNIFSLSGEYKLLHFCDDNGWMNLQFEKFYGIHTKLNNNNQLVKNGEVYYNEPVFTLIYSRTSNLEEDLKKQLKEVKKICLEKNINKIATIKKDVIFLRNGINFFFDTFEDTNIEILVCLDRDMKTIN